MSQNYHNHSFQVRMSQNDHNHSFQDDSKSNHEKNVWRNSERVNLMQSIWVKNPQNKMDTKKSSSSTGSYDSSMSSSSSVSLSSSSSTGSLSSELNEGILTPPPVVLSIEHQKRGRLLLNQIFNGLEIFEMDRIYYETIVGITPLLPFRQLVRSVNFDATGVSQMMSETQRQFDLYVCFLNAMYAELKKAQTKPALDKYQIFWKQIADDDEKSKLTLGIPLVKKQISETEELKIQLEKGTKLTLKNFTGEWESALCRIQTMGKCPQSLPIQFQNLEVLPFDMENLIKVLENVRIGIWLLFVQLQFENGKSPNMETQKVNKLSNSKGTTSRFVKKNRK